MAELVRTNDPVVISVIEGLLTEEEIPYQVADRNIAVLEGSINAFQMRILVPDDRREEAVDVLVNAELTEYLHH
jgi:hypothetical protein